MKNETLAKQLESVVANLMRRPRIYVGQKDGKRVTVEATEDQIQRARAILENNPVDKQIQHYGAIYIVAPSAQIEAMAIAEAVDLHRQRFCEANGLPPIDENRDRARRMRRQAIRNYLTSLIYAHDPRVVKISHILPAGFVALETKGGTVIKRQSHLTR